MKEVVENGYTDQEHYKYIYARVGNSKLFV